MEVGPDLYSFILVKRFGISPFDVLSFFSCIFVEMT